MRIIYCIAYKVLAMMRLIDANENKFAPNHSYRGRTRRILIPDRLWRSFGYRRILSLPLMTQAAGMYNALLQQKQPAVLIESLNGYRLKESLPSNLGAFTVALGTSECTRAGSDLTIVSYGSTFRLAEAAAEKLAQYDIDVELIDLRSLLPFDLTQNIASAKNQPSMIVDEDVLVELLPIFFNNY